MNVRTWIHGIGAAFITAFASTLTAIVVSPNLFWDHWQNFLMSAAASGILGAAFYLQKSPLPAINISSDSQTTTTITLQPNPTVNPSSTGTPETK